MKTTVCSSFSAFVLTVLFTLMLTLSVTVQPVLANNINVSTPSLTGQNPSLDNTNIQFNLSWENSWRDVVNWDAAWVFVKFRGADGIWRHASLSNAAVDHNGAGYTVEPGTDGKGIFIYRPANGSGNVALSAVQLRWNYGTDGVGDNDLVTVKVFAVEMVYIPQGAFFAGDGATAGVAGQFSQGNTTAPYQITGEAALTLGGTALANLGNRNAAGQSVADDFNSSATQTLPAAYPKGFNPFYSMKYELSEQQWVDFFNTLTATQKTLRDITGNSPTLGGKNTDAVSFRNTIAWPDFGDATTTRPDRACNFLNRRDVSAYLDWAALRPISELEFEKACRGTLAAVANEYAWGTTTVVEALTISGTEDGTETITTPNANANIPGANLTGGDAGNGLVRCGIFARSATTREQAGATFYGVMEMSGNGVEFCVVVGSNFGRLFVGTHGDGSLSADGDATNADWLLGFSFGARGGDFNFSTSQISNREFINLGLDSFRSISFSGRGGRSAPGFGFGRPDVAPVKNLTDEEIQEWFKKEFKPSPRSGRNNGLFPFSPAPAPDTKVRPTESR